MAATPRLAATPEPRYAGPWRRLAAWFVDFVIGSVFVVGLTAGGFWLVSQSPECGGGARQTLEDADACSNGQLGVFLGIPALGVLLVSPVYSIMFLRVRAQTPGMQALGLRAAAADSRPPRWGVRWLVGWGSFFLFSVVGPLAVRVTILTDPRRQGLHDKAARVVVVRSVPDHRDLPRAPTR